MDRAQGAALTNRGHAKQKGNSGHTKQKGNSGGLIFYFIF
jgi:hypothetical protein